LLVACGLVRLWRTAEQGFDAPLKRGRSEEDETEPYEDDGEDGSGDNQNRGDREAHVGIGSWNGARPLGANEYIP
jgi:hypothetical protein